MQINPAAGKPADPSILVNVPKLVTSYYELRPDPNDPRQRIVFGTSGHRGSSFDGAFNEWHILAITQAICDYRASQKIDGPLFLGMDTHALSEPAFASALEVLGANNIEVMLSEGTPYTPTPTVSHAILRYNLGRKTGLADGIVITPSTIPRTTVASSTILRTADLPIRASRSGSNRRLTIFSAARSKASNESSSRKLCEHPRRIDTIFCMPMSMI